jgi:hypothetical protein
MCKEMPVIPVIKVVDSRRIIGKMKGQGGGEAQWVADPKKQQLHTLLSYYDAICSLAME